MKKFFILLTILLIGAVIYLSYNSSPIKTTVKGEIATHLNKKIDITFEYPSSYTDNTYGWGVDCVTNKTCRTFTGNPGFAYNYREETSTDTGIIGVENIKVHGFDATQYNSVQVGLTEKYEDALLLSHYEYKNNELYKTYTSINAPLGGLYPQQVDDSPESRKLYTTILVPPSFTNNYGQAFYLIQTGDSYYNSDRYKLCTFKQYEMLGIFCFTTYLAPEQQNISTEEYEATLSKLDILNNIATTFRFTH